MNNETRQYPAALYSAVSEIGYRTERYTGEVVRSGSGHSRGAHRRRIFERFRQPAAEDRSPRNGRLVVIYPMHEAR